MFQVSFLKKAQMIHDPMKNYKRLLADVVVVDKVSHVPGISMSQRMSLDPYDPSVSTCRVLG